VDVHGDIERLAGSFLEGSLSEEEDREVAAHADECEACADVLAAAEAAARTSPRLWETEGFARVAKGLAAAGVLAALLLVGSVFQDGVGALAAPSEAGDAVVSLGAPRKAPPVDREPAPEALHFDAPVGGGAGGGGRGFRGIGGAPPAPSDPFGEDPKLIRREELKLEAEAFAAAHERIAAIVGEARGFVHAADVQKLPNGKTLGTLTVRVPPQAFEAVLDRIRALGAVRHESVTTRDVTKVYLDLESRLSSKEVLIERLKTMLAEAKGGVKDLLEVEVQIGRTIEEVEALKGQLKYYDSAIAFSTIEVQVSERDLRQPVEVVETLTATLALSVKEAEPVYARAQAVVLDAGGQVTEAHLSREGEGAVTGLVRARIDAARFPDVRQELRSLGHVTRDAADRRRAAQGDGSKAGNVPVRSELAALEIRLAALSPQITRQVELEIETGDVDPAYREARRALEEAGARIAGGGLSAGAAGSSATLGGEIDVDREAALLGRLSSLGKVKRSETRHSLPVASAAPVHERARIDLKIATPPLLVPEEHGLARTARATFSGSVAGLLWSVERLLVGLFLAAPWAATLIAVWLVWQRLRRPRIIEPQPTAGPMG